MFRVLRFKGFGFRSFGGLGFQDVRCKLWASRHWDSWRFEGCWFFQRVSVCIYIYMFRLRGWLHGFSLLPGFQ